MNKLCEYGRKRNWVGEKQKVRLNYNMNKLKNGKEVTHLP